jgi:tetratricopeptide (TPR) repeat protein
MKIKSMRKVKAILTLLVTFTSLLPFQEANAQLGSSYVLPPFAPSNTPILPCSSGVACGFGKEGGSDQQSSLIDSLYEKASDANYNGNYSTAFQIYTRIISLDPQEAQAYFNRGGIKQSNLNDGAGAAVDFRMAAKLFRQQGDDHMTRASIERIQQLNGRTGGVYDSGRNLIRRNSDTSSSIGDRFSSKLPATIRNLSKECRQDLNNLLGEKTLIDLYYADPLNFNKILRLSPTCR